MSNQERAAEVMETHDLFHFTSGDGWMEPHEDVIRCACGEEFFSYIQTGDGSGDDDRDPNLLYRQHLAQDLADAGLLAPGLPEPDDASIFVPDGAGWQTPQDSTVWTAIGGRVMIQRVEPGNFTPGEARSLALALLAAAKLAEEQE